jgi:hypothetical protein
MTFGDCAEPNEAWPAQRTAALGPTVLEAHQPRRFVMLKRLGLAGATAFIAVNIWTGCPLVALWVGSQAVGKGTLSMAAVCVVIVVLAALVFVMAVMLTWLNGVYAELTGCPRSEPRATWLRSMRAEGEDSSGQTVGVTALERIVMINVYIAVITLVVWYVAFAGAPSPVLCTRCF